MIPIPIDSFYEMNSNRCFSCLNYCERTVFCILPQSSMKQDHYLPRALASTGQSKQQTLLCLLNNKIKTKILIMKELQFARWFISYYVFSWFWQGVVTTNGIVHFFDCLRVENAFFGKDVVFDTSFDFFIDDSLF